MLTMSLATGLAVQTGVLEDTIVAFESIDTWKFVRPVFIGDTVHVELTVEQKEERTIRGSLKVGHVTLKASVKKQTGKVCQEGIWSMLMKMRSNE